MTPRLARRLLGLTLTTLIGYGYGWWGRAYGITPLLALTAVALTAWFGGYVWAAQQHGAVTALANRERDLAFAEVVSIREGRRYEPVSLDRVRAMGKHPAGRR